ncbi:MAG: hypothetical protein ACYC7H_09915, partial [Chloroflexota bacterium]
AAVPGGSTPAVLVGPRERWVNLGFVTTLCLGAALFLPWVKPLLPLPPNWRSLVDIQTPVGAAQYLVTQQSDARIFNSDLYGDYLVWRADGSPPVFLDTRVELYPESVWRDYTKVSLAQDWRTICDKYRINLLVLPRNGGYKGFQLPLLGDALRSPEWTVVYEDSISVVFSRVGSSEGPDGEPHVRK